MTNKKIFNTISFWLPIGFLFLISCITIILFFDGTNQGYPMNARGSFSTAPHVIDSTEKAITIEWVASKPANVAELYYSFDNNSFVHLVSNITRVDEDSSNNKSVYRTTIPKSQKGVQYQVRLVTGNEATISPVLKYQ